MPLQRYAVQSQTLREAVDHLTNDPAPYDLTSELALMRATVQDALNAYAAAKEEGNERAILAVGALLRATLKEVGDFAKVVQGIELNTVMQVHTVTNVLQAFENMLHMYFPRDPRVEQMMNDLPSLIRLESTIEGTTITPDEEVRAMDATIPMWEESEQV